MGRAVSKTSVCLGVLFCTQTDKRFFADFLAALMAELADPDVRRSLAVTDLGEGL
jgi:hypothetical protein